jgi:excisionase family DNA binding protein
MMSATLDDKRILVTPREAAAALSISTRTLWTLTNRGELQCVRIGRSVRYKISTLREFAERKGGIA